MTSIFKFKTKKKLQVLTERTLDYKHNIQLQKLKDDKNTIYEKKKILNKLQKERDEINKQKNINISTENINKGIEINKQIKEIEKGINNIENNKYENEYFFNTSDILINYYDIIEKQKDNNLDFYNINNKENDNEFYIKETDTKTNRANLLEQYMELTDTEYVAPPQFNNINICSNCNEEMTLIQQEGIVVCLQCGTTNYILIESEKPSFKEPVPENSYFAYKRINHFNEWLAQFQAKESTEIPDDVYDKILYELNKCRISDLSLIKSSQIRTILKKLKLNKYYEHVAHIINKLNGLPPPTISREIEDKLRIMFKQIQQPFEECCPKDRKNFLSYSYVLHKFTELLGLKQYQHCFKLLKSREKLIQQDKIWKCICNKLDWEFNHSI
jgi:hypothetical protein